jgi:pseudolysin
MKLVYPHSLSRLALVSFSLLYFNQTLAAVPVNLKEKLAPSVHASSIKLNEIKRSFDFNKTLHIRFQQTYSGYPVWGADGVMHIPNADARASLSSPTTNTTMNGWAYQNISADLSTSPASSFTVVNANKAWEQAISISQNTHSIISEKKNVPIIFMDNDHKAHWAYHISFLTTSSQHIPSKPNFIIDAITHKIYKKWDNVQTETLAGGGLGGNEKIGQVIYDGLPGHESAFDITRDASSQMCYLRNDEVTIFKHNPQSEEDSVASFLCTAVNNQHNNVYWRDVMDAANGAYSPENDALQIGKTVIRMYKEWYGIPPLTEDDQPMMLTMRVHVTGYENAFWDGDCITLGDGADQFYPFVTLGIGAHEISHGFTEQHSNLIYEGQSGGLNESFSDMADRAAYYYVNQLHDWKIGGEITKNPNVALRYMDEPTKDCANISAGQMCSISNVRDYHDNLNVHYSSGVFNKFFYLLATSANWNVKKAFDVMVQANRGYWTSESTFSEAACGVLHAASDYGYDVNTVITAASGVGIDVSQC